MPSHGRHAWITSNGMPRYAEPARSARSERERPARARRQFSILCDQRAFCGAFEPELGEIRPSLSPARLQYQGPAVNAKDRQFRTRQPRDDGRDVSVLSLSGIGTVYAKNKRSQATWGSRPSVRARQAAGRRTASAHHGWILRARV